MRMRSESYPGTAALFQNPITKSSTPVPLSAPPCSANTPTATRVPKFLRCLYEILYVEDPTILSWSKDGTNFQIYDTRRLEAQVLPKYFKHGKFASFQRQLNNFGFRKWTKTQSNVCTFSHHHFVQRHPDQLVELIIAQNAQSYKQPKDHKENNNPTNNNKRKRSESSCHDVSNKMIKTEHASIAQGWLDTNEVPEPAPVKQEASALEDVEPWGLMIDIMPMQWNAKIEPGNETPTTISAQAESAFEFSMEELDDLLTSTTSSEAMMDEERLIDLRMLNEYFASSNTNDSSNNSQNQPVEWNAEDLFCKSDLDLYVQEPELWIN